MVVMKTIEAIADMIDNMPFNSTLEIAAWGETPEEAENWWGISKFHRFDDDLLLFDIFGGGYPTVYSLTHSLFANTKEILKDFFHNTPDFGDATCAYPVEIAKEG